jgi:predicted alpha/beta superfamily hydrolase
MRELKPIAFLLFILAGCASKDNPIENKDSRINFTQFSESVRDTFYIDIQLPTGYFENPDKKYPMVVLVDGNFYFPMMASISTQYEMAGLLEPSILVGVGYKSFKLMDSLRVRDYMYPKALPSDEMNAVGGGRKFYEYLTKELLPKVDAQFRTDRNKALLGHSFGGFALYAC